MDNFIYRSPACIVKGPGSINRLPEFLDEFDAKVVLVISDPGLAKVGIVEAVSKVISSGSAQVIAFTEVEADPSIDTVNRAIAAGAAADVVIGLGGGSSMDVAKLVSLLVKSPQEFENIYGVGLCKGERLPLIQIPTTSGTGSEVTPVAVVTATDHTKKPIVSPLLLPDVAMLDAELTLNLPAHITAATGIDAIVHAFEAYTSSVRKNIFTDMLAKQALTLLCGNLLKVIRNPGDIEARDHMLFGSLLAGQAFANASVGAIHALAYPLGGQFSIPHGLSNSLVMPHVMQFNLPEASKEYAELYCHLDIGELQGTANQAQGFIDYLIDLTKQSELPVKLSHFGITAEHINGLVADALAQDRLLSYNIKSMGKDDIYKVYENAI